MIDIALYWAVECFYEPFSYTAGVMFTLIFFVVLIRVSHRLYSR